jgi:putative hydrolase
MRIEIDTHTHSVASGHAYSTVEEMAKGARRAGLRGFALTDHGPALAGTPHPYHFGNLRILPARLNGVRLYKGVEANIMDMEGSLDLETGFLAKLDFVMAGFHRECFVPRGMEDNTRALVAALRNPLVDAVSHPGNPEFPVDPAAVVAAARECGKAIEINSGSFRIRIGSDRNCLDFARLCARTGTRIVCGSDAHFSGDVGRLSAAKAVLKEAGVPRELVANASLRSFDAFLERGKAARADRTSTSV